MCGARDGGAQAPHGCAEGAFFGRRYRPSAAPITLQANLKQDQTPKLAGLQRRISQHQPLGTLVEVYLHTGVMPRALRIHYDALAKLRMTNALAETET